MGSLLSCTPAAIGGHANFRQSTWPSLTCRKSGPPPSTLTSSGHSQDTCTVSKPLSLTVTSSSPLLDPHTNTRPVSSTLASSCPSPRFHINAESLQPASNCSTLSPTQEGPPHSTLTLSASAQDSPRTPSPLRSTPSPPDPSQEPETETTSGELPAQNGASRNLTQTKEMGKSSPSAAGSDPLPDAERTKETSPPVFCDPSQDAVPVKTGCSSPAASRRPSLDLSRRALQLRPTMLRSAVSDLEMAVRTGRWGSQDGKGRGPGVVGRWRKGRKTESTECPHTSSWKFWRKLSTRRPDKKSRWSPKHAANGIASTEVTEAKVRPRDLDLRPPSGGEGGGAAPATSGSLPDVLDKAVLTRTTSLKAPPKPPRLFLCRSSSLNQCQPASAASEESGPIRPLVDPKTAPGDGGSFRPPQDTGSKDFGDRAKNMEEDSEPIYVNAAFGAALKSALSGNDRMIPPSIHATTTTTSTTSTKHRNIRDSDDKTTGEGHSDEDRVTTLSSETKRRPWEVKDSEARKRAGEARQVYTKVFSNQAGSCEDTLPRPSRPSSSLTLSPIYYSLPHRPKTRYRMMTSHITAHQSSTRTRPKSVDKPEQPRHQVILHSVLDLMCQRFDPFPHLESLHSAGVLTDLDVQAFGGHPDRRLICEHVLNAVGNGDFSLFTAFLDVLRASGSQREIVRVLDALRDLDSVIHDYSSPPDMEEEEEEEECQILAEEKILSFEVGYLAADGVSLKPLVELERVRAGDRKSLPRMHHTDVGLHSSHGVGGDMVGTALFSSLSGPVMINACITGHNLCGPRALALAQVLRQHSCILELRIGKTRLCSADMAALCGALRHNTTLASLDVRLNVLSYVGASAIASVLSHSHVLQQLNLSSTGLEVEGCREVLSAVSSNRSLRELDLSFLNVGDAVCDSVHTLLRTNSVLRRLRLRSNNFTAAGVSIIAEGLHRNHSLLELDLSRNSLGDGGIEALARYIPDSFLAEISLENCNVTSAASGALSQMIISSKRLRSLDLSVNPVGDEGVLGLAAALERSSVLHSLSLNMCGITNDGFSTLLDVLEKNTSIWLLKLCYNHLGRQHRNQAATSDNLRYRLRIVTSSKPKLKILLWGNAFSDLQAEDRRGSRRYSSLR